MRGDHRLYTLFEELGIHVEYHEHPAAPTIEEAQKHWKGIDSTHCKNLFFRNHKGNKHYLVILHYKRQLIIRDLEQRLQQGKISFASDKRLEKYLGLKAGSVSPFGLINDKELMKAKRLSFHPNINTASLIISFNDFIKFLDYTGNSYEFIELY